MLRTVNSFAPTGNRTPVAKPGRVIAMGIPQIVTGQPSASAFAGDTVHFGGWGSDIDAYTDALMAKKIGYYQDRLDKAPGNTDEDKIIFLSADEDSTSSLPDVSYYQDRNMHREVTRTIYFQLAGSETVYVLKRTRAMDKERWRTVSISEVPLSDSSDFPTKPYLWGWHNQVKMKEEGHSEKGFKPSRSTVYYPTRRTNEGDAPCSESPDNVNSLMELAGKLGDVLDRVLMERRFNPPPEPED